MKLSGSQIKELREILIEAFDRSAFTRALAESSPSRNLQELVSEKGFSDQVFQLISVAEREGWLSQLGTLLEVEVPGRKDLIARARGIFESGTDGSSGAPGESPPANGSGSEDSESQTGPPLLFYSYAREDESLREQLAKQLKLLERQKIIRSWYDGCIVPGDEREPAIRRKLGDADIILLLASSDYLASDDIWNRDLDIALKRYDDRQDDVRVIPIILRPIVWDDTPFSHLKPLPFDKRAVTDRSGPNRDRAFAEIARAIREVAVKISTRSS